MQYIENHVDCQQVIKYFIFIIKPLDNKALKCYIKTVIKYNIINAKLVFKDK